MTGELIAHSGGDAGAQAACITCHGLAGEGDGNLVPRLAGMERGHFLRQMEYYSEGLRRHPQMTWIADHVDWPARQRLSIYYEELPWPRNVPEPGLEPDGAACEPAIIRLYHEGDPSRGLASCASCHGDDGMGVGAGNPAVAAQPAPYIAAQLRKWRQGERYATDGNMLAISRLLADEEVAPLADYIAALPGANPYPAPREACPRLRRPDPRSGA